MRMTQAALNKLPKVRLYISEKTYFWVPYKNAPKSIKGIPLLADHFKENGKGLPWACGLSKAVMEFALHLPHPVYYVHTIGSTIYVVAMVDRGGLPRFAIRYRHHQSELVSAFDESRREPAKQKLFMKLLDKRPTLTLERAKHESGKGSHSPGTVSGHREPHAPHGDKNKRNLNGSLRRAIAAGFVPKGLAVA